MGVEGHIPLRIIEEGVELAKSWVVPLITPSEAPILQVNFFKLTRLQCNPEPIDPTPVKISLVSVSCAVNLVEITKF